MRSSLRGLLRRAQVNLDDVPGPLSPTEGGTGLITIAQGDLLYGLTADVIATLAKNTTAKRYLSNQGMTNAPAWGQVDLTDGVTGTLPVGSGGSGATTLTGYLKGNGTGAFTASASIPNTDISGLGTMSTQNANNVAITGGAIDGTTLGATTRSSARVTTLDANGNITTTVSDTRVMYSSSGVITGAANLTFNGTTLTAHTATVSTGNFTVSTGTTSLAGVTGIGTSPASDFYSANSRLRLEGGTAITARNTGGATAANTVLWNDATTGDNQFILFGTEGSFTQRGQIIYNRAGGLVAYQTTSDFASKLTAGPIDDALERLMKLKPKRARMSGARLTVDSFLAHEVEAVMPECVTGCFGGYNLKSGQRQLQQVDKSQMIPLLVASVQRIAQHLNLTQ